MPILHKACCCCYLSTAAMLLGWLGSIGYFITIVTVIVGMVNAPNFAVTNNLLDIMRIIVLVVTLLISFLNLAGCGCLMVGAVKKIRPLVLPWLFGQIIYIAVLIISDIIYLIDLIGHNTDIVPPFCLLTAYLAFQIYFWVCVYSLFQEIREDDSRQTLGVEPKRLITLIDDLPPYASFV